MTQARLVLLCVLASLVANVAFCLTVSYSRNYETQCIETSPLDPEDITEQSEDPSYDI
ncbi:MAG: hypothetical protein JSS83_25665 [Cyanobacteria bacterium SZAS LIN-3]|nr:hypothetical protein [Cyanobacteria bacterium SZAS LIN-3]